MSATTASRKVTIANPYALQHHNAAQFVQQTLKCSAANITLICDGQTADATEISHILNLDLVKGAEVTIVVEGEDAEETVDFLAAMMTGLSE